MYVHVSFFPSRFSANNFLNVRSCDVSLLVLIKSDFPRIFSWKICKSARSPCVLIQSYCVAGLRITCVTHILLETVNAARTVHRDQFLRKRESERERNRPLRYAIRRFPTSPRSIMLQSRSILRGNGKCWVQRHWLRLTFLTAISTIMQDSQCLFVIKRTRRKSRD